MLNPRNIWTKLGKSHYVIRVPDGELRVSRRAPTQNIEECMYVLEFTSKNEEGEHILGIYIPKGDLAYDEKDLPIVHFERYFLDSNLPPRFKSIIWKGLRSLDSVEEDI